MFRGAPTVRNASPHGANAVTSSIVHIVLVSPTCAGSERGRPADHAPGMPHPCWLYLRLCPTGRGPHDAGRPLTSRSGWPRQQKPTRRFALRADTYGGPAQTRAWPSCPSPPPEDRSRQHVERSRFQSKVYPRSIETGNGASARSEHTRHNRSPPRPDLPTGGRAGSGRPRLRRPRRVRHPKSSIDLRPCKDRPGRRFNAAGEARLRADDQLALHIELSLEVTFEAHRLGAHDPCDHGTRPETERRAAPDLSFKLPVDAGGRLEIQAPFEPATGPEHGGLCQNPRHRSDVGATNECEARRFHPISVAQRAHSRQCFTRNVAVVSRPHGHENSLHCEPEGGRR